MEAEIKAVADRLRGVRDVFDVTEEEAAKVCDISLEQYKLYESGTVDIPLGVLFSMGKQYGIDLTSFLTGEEPHKVSFFVTPKDKGVSVNRLADYHFQSLAFGFADRKADPFLVTINPGDIKEVHKVTHPGQEFNYVVEGQVRLYVGDNEVVLNEGDSVYFDSSKPHGQNNVGDKRCQFITIILN